MSHAGFLRDHHEGPEAHIITLVRGLWEAGERAAAVPLAEGVDLVTAALDPLLAAAPSFAEDRALLCLVVRLALAPRTMRAAELAPLRAAGWSDRELHDAVNVVCCFSYMNRLADGLGVTDHYPPGCWAERLFGAERLASHLRWAAGD